jgi:hypothetical protein
LPLKIPQTLHSNQPGQFCHKSLKTAFIFLNRPNQRFITLTLPRSHPSLTESFLKLSGLQGYKVPKEKAQLCLPQVTYLGVFLKGQTHSLSHEWINPVLHFPLPHTIKQLRAFLGVTGFWRIWIPGYAALNRHLFMLLLIFLFESYIINALNNVWLPTSLRKLVSNRLCSSGWLSTLS